MKTNSLWKRLVIVIALGVALLGVPPPTRQSAKRLLLTL